jgi:hypothetical protein
MQSESARKETNRLTASEWQALTMGLSQAQKAQVLGFSVKKIKALDRAARAGESINSIPAGKVRAQLASERPSVMKVSGGRIVKAYGNAAKQNPTSSRYIKAIVARPGATIADRLAQVLEEQEAAEAYFTEEHRRTNDIVDFSSWRNEAITRLKR